MDSDKKNYSPTEQFFQKAPHLIERYAIHIILVVLFLTGIFAVGLTMLEVEEDFDRYAQEVPEQERLDQLEEDLDTAESTVVIYTDENVLSRSSLETLLAIEADLAESSTDLSITGIDSPASVIAQRLDPTARTPSEKLEAVEQASDEELVAAGQQADESPAFRGMLSTDFDQESVEVTHGLVQITHSFPEEMEDTEIVDRQLAIEEQYDQTDGEALAWSDQRLFEESNDAIDDSMALILPVVGIMLLGFLIVAYRDPIDVALAVATLVMTLVWTFGFAGFIGIPFDQVTIATVVLLLGLGIDFGIHVINRYREERVTGRSISESIVVSSRQLNVAFFIVSITAAIGFSANIISDLGPIRNFGIVAAFGILTMFVLFATFLPALKLTVETVRERYSLPSFGSSPFGAGGGSDILTYGYRLTANAPVAFLLVVALITGGAGFVAMDMEREYAADDFLPPEDNPSYTESLPGELQPDEYAAATVFTTFDEEFEFNPDESVVIGIEGDLTANGTLSEIQEAERDAPESFVDEEGEVMRVGIIPIIERYQSTSPEFRTAVQENDQTGNGLPDTELDQIYDSLFESPYSEQASMYLSEDRDVMKIEYATSGGADRGKIAADAEQFADAFPGDAVATGEVVVFDRLDEEMVDSAALSLLLAIVVTGLFLIVMYRVLEGRGSLGIVNLVPIVVSVVMLAVTMTLFRIPLNSLNATVFAVTVGVGLDYSVHVLHRFIDEYTATEEFHRSMLVTLRGTGGALTGSVLTTAFTMLALLLAITPLLSQFGVLMALGVTYSYLASLIVLPPALIVWDKYISL